MISCITIGNSPSKAIGWGHHTWTRSEFLVCSQVHISLFKRKFRYNFLSVLISVNLARLCKLYSLSVTFVVLSGPVMRYI